MSLPRVLFLAAAILIGVSVLVVAIHFRSFDRSLPRNENENTQELTQTDSDQTQPQQDSAPTGPDSSPLEEEKDLFWASGMGMVSRTQQQLQGIRSWIYRQDEAGARLPSECRARLPLVLKALKHGDPNIRYQAVWVLQSMGPVAESAVPALIDALSDESLTGEGWQSGTYFQVRMRVREAAVSALTAIGPGAKAAVPILIKKLKHEDPKFRQSVALCLGKIGADAAVPALVEMLQDKEPHSRLWAAEALMKIEPQRAKGLPTLIELIEHKDPRVRATAAYALARIGRPASSALPPLIKALKDEDRLVRLNAASAIGEIGPEARAATPHLLELLEKDSSVRIYAAESLWKVARSREVVAVLAKELATKEHVQSAARVLGRIGPEADAAVPALIDALRKETSPWGANRREVIKSLGQIGPGAKEAVGVLATQLQQRQYFEIWFLAAEALSQIGPEAKVAVPSLVEALRDESGYVRIAAARALMKIDPEVTTRAATTKLIETLKDEDAGVRLKAVVTLGENRSTDERVVKALTHCFTDKNEDVRKAAAVALQSIRQ